CDPLGGCPEVRLGDEPIELYPLATQVGRLDQRGLQGIREKCARVYRGECPEERTLFVLKFDHGPSVAAKCLDLPALHVTGEDQKRRSRTSDSGGRERHPAEGELR